jgi:hypothetical protein
MKKLATLVAALVLAIPAPLAISAPAQAAANPNVEFCKGYVGSDPTLDPELNRGECVSLLTTTDNYYGKNGKNGHAVAVHWCDYYAENYLADFDAIWGSMDVCIEDVESTL